VFLADRIGLVALIAHGYRALAVTILAVFVAPLLTLGVRRLLRAGDARSVVRNAKGGTS
jgi:hypothetical protein